MINHKKWFFGKISYPDKDRDRVFTTSEIDQIKAGHAVIYFNGRICYQDIFKKIRHTDFCIQWIWKSGNLSPATYCDKGNEAD